MIHRARLTDKEGDLSPVFGAEAIALAVRLTRESFALAGIPVPTYTRQAIPVRFVRRLARD